MNTAPTLAATRRPGTQRRTVAEHTERLNKRWIEYSLASLLMVADPTRVTKQSTVDKQASNENHVLARSSFLPPISASSGPNNLLNIHNSQIVSHTITKTIWHVDSFCNNDVMANEQSNIAYLNLIISSDKTDRFQGSYCIFEWEIVYVNITQFFIRAPGYCGNGRMLRIDVKQVLG